MITLALDLGIHTGYALLDNETGQVQKVGQWHLGRNLVKVMRSSVPAYRLWKRLTDLEPRVPLDAIIFEGTFRHGTAGYHLTSMETVSILFAMTRSLKWMRVNPSAWKKAVVGHGRAPASDYVACAKQHWPGVEVRTEDIAAALCLLSYWQQANALAAG